MTEARAGAAGGEATPAWVWFDRANLAEQGQACYALIERLYPLCRSITGEGLRETLRIVDGLVGLELTEVPSGTQVFDWVVPKEWNIRGATLKGPFGETVVDFARHNLHVVNYSVPVRARLPLDELRPKLHSLPEHPTWIPYRTSYYTPDWGFCVPHDVLERLPEGEYEVTIDSQLSDGSLTFGECRIPGREADEVVLFTHACHPSMCNDNLSGVSVATALAQTLQQHALRYTYRVVFAPTTIGSLCWLHHHRRTLDRIRAGLILAVAGDAGALTYKRSRQGNSHLDRAVVHALTTSGKPHTVVEFSPYGYDERQFCSPGINLAMGRLTRSPNGAYPEYHTSADDLTVVRPDCLADTLATCLDVVEILENDRTCINRRPFGEPQLGKRGLYRAQGGHRDVEGSTLAMLWVLNLSDGAHSLLDIAERAALPFGAIQRAAAALLETDLLEVQGGGEGGPA